MAGEPTQTKAEKIDIARFRVDADYRRQIMEAKQAEIEAERAARDCLPMRRQRVAIRESFRAVRRSTFEAVFHTAPVPVFSSYFRRLVARRVRGELRELQWRLPRRYPRLAPLFD
jgi:hypothetical protein